MASSPASPTRPMENTLLKLIDAQHRLALQVQTLTGAISDTCRHVGAASLRDAVLWQALGAAMLDTDPAFVERMRARLDFLLLSMGDDPAFGKAVSQAHGLLDALRGA